MTLTTAPSGDFGPAVVVAGPSGLVFLSGVGPRPAGSTAAIPESFDAQLAATFDALDAALASRGLGWPNVAKILLHLTDVREHDRAWAAVVERFGADWMPARTTIEVDNLPDRGARLQLDVIAAG
jgi:enamine deaminase RidA (YjgF/YER057c/UK114 family)